MTSLQYNYVDESGTATVSGAVGSNGHVVIPETVTSPTGVACTVIGIDSWAFYNNNEITSVAIPESVITIGSGAFRQMSKLESINIPSGVTTIKGSVFWKSTSLNTVTFAPNSQLTSIESLAFQDTPSLSSITFPSSLTTVAFQAFMGVGANMIFDVNNEKLIFYNPPQAGTPDEYTIPDGVSSIIDYAFASYGGNLLTQITVPDSVTNISSTAFTNGSIGLDYVVISASNGLGIQSPGENVDFGGKTVTTYVELPSSNDEATVRAGAPTLTPGQNSYVLSIGDLVTNGLAHEILSNRKIFMNEFFKKNKDTLTDIVNVTTSSSSLGLSSLTKPNVRIIMASNTDTELGNGVANIDLTSFEADEGVYVYIPDQGMIVIQNNHTSTKIEHIVDTRHTVTTDFGGDAETILINKFPGHTILDGNFTGVLGSVAGELEDDEGDGDAPPPDGDAGAGDAGSGDAGSGDAGAGDAGSGDAGSGDAGAGGDGAGAGTTSVPICFPAGTPVMTNMGEIAIEKLNLDIHNIRGKRIVAITETSPTFKYIIRIEKDAMGPNIPSRRTEISRDHEVFYKGKMMRSEDLVDKCEGVCRIKYHGAILYNVLMEKHDKMVINNLICETLHPNNIMAKICGGKYTSEEKKKLYNELNSALITNDLNACKKLYASLK